MATKSVAVPVGIELRTAQRSQWTMALERFRAHRPAVAGVVVLGTLALLSAAAPLVSPYDPDKTALLLIYDPPSLAHPFGTDDLGRDLATRILYGGRVSLAIGLLAVTVAVSIGTLASGAGGATAVCAGTIGGAGTCAGGTGARGRARPVHGGAARRQLRQRHGRADPRAARARDRCR